MDSKQSTLAEQLAICRTPLPLTTTTQMCMRSNSC